MDCSPAKCDRDSYLCPHGYLPSTLTNFTIFPPHIASIFMKHTIYADCNTIYKTDQKELTDIGSSQRVFRRSESTGRLWSAGVVRPGWGEYRGSTGLLMLAPPHGGTALCSTTITAVLREPVYRSASCLVGCRPSVQWREDI